MTDKVKQQPQTGVKPVPMKLFATWEVDRTPPNCIPRLCSLTLSRLVVLRSLGSDVSFISIAVKMQAQRPYRFVGSKRTLRSNEMALPPNGMLDTELQLHFSLQYPHFIKRDGNKLHVMLQRRKRYKNRTILGYKTLADGVVNMSQVLQRPLDFDLDLFSEAKEAKGHMNVAAKVTVNSLTSQPVDYEGTTGGKTSHHAGRGAVVGDFSDEDDEFSSNDDGSDSEPMLEDHRVRKTSLPPTARQRNLKQKLMALLRRFRVSEDALHGLDADRAVISSKLSGGDMDPAEIEDLFEELDLSDSGPEMDTMSISSTPKPSLRPFFSSSRSLLHEDSRPSNLGQGVVTDPPKIENANTTETSSSVCSPPRPHLKRFFSSSDDSEPTFLVQGTTTAFIEPPPKPLQRALTPIKEGQTLDEGSSSSTVLSPPRPHLKRFFISSSEDSDLLNQGQGD